ncbi:AMP-dependent synthetase, partial [Corallococcus sp. CA047B]|uniref:AMP-binding protein n=1 Tax=Corallococcus sp. CA047B TaxID=2316729 RepID=UPI000EEAFF78
MERTNTLAALLARGRAEDVAISAPGRPGLTYGALRELTAQVRASLHWWGLGAGDRIALVLPNGPEMAAAFIAVASAATTAPLNPAYRADEFTFYLDDLQARALLILEGMESPARAVAKERNLPLIELSPTPDGPAGHFTLKCEHPFPVTAAHAEGAHDSDVALVLHTSGTTARPKLVPLTHANLTASARHIGALLGLGPGDTCLNIMPLFHIHGLVAAVLSSLGAGGRVVCTPGFNALRFFAWFEEARPTWYTAVPTMHQALVERARRNTESLKSHRLRFIRSSSASLPPQVME